MFLLDWRLALFSLALLPFFVLLARRVGNQRRKITTVKQGAMADISSLVQESLSGVRDPARQDDGPQRRSSRSASTASRRTSPTSRCARRMAGRWMMAAIQTSFAVMPALVYLFAGLAPGAASIGTIVAFTTLQTRLLLPGPVAAVGGVDIQTSTALFDRVFEYLDLRGRHRARHARAGRRARRGALRRRLVPLRRRVDAARRRHHRRARHAHRAGRRDRRGQDLARLSRGAPVRPRAGRGARSTASTCAS